jgi:shikimate kinase
MANCEKILIAGFSGSGKTGLLRHLEQSSPSSDWHFSDLDQLVMKTHKVTDLASLIEIHGWEKFRIWERQALEGWLKEEGKGVLSLGGGTLSQMVFDLYRPSRRIKFCYIYSSFEDCWERLHLQNTEVRPLVRLGKSELLSIYEQREAVFSQINWKLVNSQATDLGELSKEFWREVLTS